MRARAPDSTRRAGARGPRHRRHAAFTAGGAHRGRPAHRATDSRHAVSRLDALRAVRVAALPAVAADLRAGAGHTVPAARRYPGLRGRGRAGVSGPARAGAVGPRPRPRPSRGPALAPACTRREPASGPAPVPRRLGRTVPARRGGRPRPRGSMRAVPRVRAAAATLPVRGGGVATAVVPRAGGAAGRAGVGARDQRRARPRARHRHRAGHTARVAHPPRHRDRPSVRQLRSAGGPARRPHRPAPEDRVAAHREGPALHAGRGRGSAGRDRPGVSALRASPSRGATCCRASTGPSSNRSRTCAKTRTS